ncbi:unnamed protein product [Leptosia nina]|uniref:Uncharacterized protein n=1 Tax=Leptosia nina TaxID=320188 RepID=A0AAV1JGY7_9NEOP
MAPSYGYPEPGFPVETVPDEPEKVGSSEMAMWYTLVLILIIVIWLVMYFSLRLLTLRQKTRNPQQRRGYMGSRSQTSLPASEPTVYVSPANLPPPPKYEAMAPPSYEEVVGIHYPAYQPPPQPISQPITNALATQNNTSNVTSSTSNDTRDVTNTTSSNVTNNVTPAETTTVTTIDERRPVASTA